MEREKEGAWEKRRNKETRTATLARTPKGAFAIFGHKVAPFELSSPPKKWDGGRGREEGEKAKRSPNQEQFENPPYNI